MLDLGWTELLLIGIVALIVVGPKDLPVMFRALGRFTGKMRGMAREFSRAMDEAADQSGARDIARDLRSMSNPRSAATRKFKSAAGLDDIEKAFDDEVEDEGAKATSPRSDAPKQGPETAALAEKRTAEAKTRREEAVRRANERSASFRGFEHEGEAGAGPAPEPGGDAPARRAEPVGGVPGAEDAAAEAKQDKA
jgi:sec-independent protein translocase protein TatB